MKRYEVCVSYTLCATYYLDANSEAQAVQLAKDSLRAITMDTLAASYSVKTKYKAIKPEYSTDDIHVDSVEELD